MIGGTLKQNGAYRLGYLGIGYKGGRGGKDKLRGLYICKLGTVDDEVGMVLAPRRGSGGTGTPKAVNGL